MPWHGVACGMETDMAAAIGQVDAELEAALHEELSRIAGDYLAAADADAKLRELHEERLRLEDEWLSLSE